MNAPPCENLRCRFSLSDKSTGSGTIHPEVRRVTKLLFSFLCLFVHSFVWHYPAFSFFFLLCIAFGRNYFARLFDASHAHP